MADPTNNESAILVRMEALGDKLDGVHLSLTKDIGEINGKLDEHGNRISSTELKIARMQGAGAALTLGLPFVAIAINHLLH